MKIRIISLAASLLIILLIAGCNSDDSMLVNEPVSLEKNVTGSVAYYDLSQEEIDGLIYMRIEEKLARDVFTALGSLYNYKVFQNISFSEQKHMDAVKRLLVKYGIEDPVLSDEPGIFPDEQFQQLYDQYVTQGNVSLNEALSAGIMIEETEIADLDNQLTNVVDNPDIIKAFQNLKASSVKHLASLNRCLVVQSVSTANN